MMRPPFLHVGGTLRWTLLTRNPDTLVLKDADSLPTIAVRKNGSPVGDAVTITKRAATTGIYDCVYTPAGPVETDRYQFEEAATVTGTVTAQLTYHFVWSCLTIALERGTNDAALASGVNVTQWKGVTPNDLLAGRIDASVGAYQSGMAPPTTTQIEAALLNEGDGQALVAAIIARIETSLDASDTSVQAIAVAVRNEILNRLLSGNHETAGSVGKLLQKLAVSGTLAHSDDAATYRASGFATPSDVTSARDAITGRLPAALIGGRMDASVGATQTDALSAAGLSAAAVLKIAAQITADHGSGSYVSSGSSGLTSSQETVLNQIAARCALIVGAALTSAGPVTPGGRILLIVGNDHVVSAGSTLNRSITDPGGLLHARLTASGTTLQFGAGRLNASQQISGTISGVTHASGITTIALEITHSQIAATALPADDYVYQIQRRTSAGAQVIEVSGDLTLERRRVNRVS